MNSNLQILLTIAIPTISVWVAALISNSRLSAMEVDVKSLLRSDASNTAVLANIGRQMASMEVDVKSLEMDVKSLLRSDATNTVVLKNTGEQVAKIEGRLANLEIQPR